MMNEKQILNHIWSFRHMKLRQPTIGIRNVRLNGMNTTVELFSCDTKPSGKSWQSRAVKSGDLKSNECIWLLMRSFDKTKILGFVLKGEPKALARFRVDNDKVWDISL